MRQTSPAFSSRVFFIQKSFIRGLDVYATAAYIRNIETAPGRLAQGIKTMQTINHGAFVTVAGWNRAYAFSTLAGYVAKTNRDLAPARARAIANGHDLAWCINSGTCLYGDKAAGARALAQEAAELASAVIVADGEQVQIDGELYTVKVMGQRYSDPIHFKRVG
jgi:hypothetical protein